MSSKIKQQQYFLWQSMIPQLRRNIDRCLYQIKEKSIHINPPQGIQHKINKIKNIFQQDTLFDEEEFLDVIAFFIQQKQNISLLQLSGVFTLTFGKDNQFWTQKISHWANLNTFTNSLTIWNVTQFLRNFINYSTSPLQRDFIYQWRQKVQAYLSSLEFLVRKIQRLKKTDNSFAIDDSYIKYHKEKMLYITFVTKFGMRNNNDDSKLSYHDEVTVTFQNKTKAEKKLFNFPQATRTIDGMSNFTSKQRYSNKKSGNNTLEKYNFIKSKHPSQKSYQDTNQIKERRQRHHQQLVKNLTLIGKMSTFSINELRDELLHFQSQYRHELEIQKEKFQERLRDHVVKFTAKKNRSKKQKLKKQEKKKMNEQIIEKMQEKQQQLQKQIEMTFPKQIQILNSNNGSQQKKMQMQEFQPLPLFYQVIEQQQLQSPQYRKYPMSHATFIHNPLDYYSFQGQPIGQRNIPVSNPFDLYPFINYYLNDRQEYEEFMAVSLGQVSFRSDDSIQDTQNEEGLQIQEDESYFIDKRAIITSENVDWDKLAPEDRMKFDQIVDQNKLKWVADYKHENSQQFFSRFSSLPVYGTQLPYMITGTDIRTKRNGHSSRLKSNQIVLPNHLDEIQIIVQNAQEDFSMTTTMNKKIEELGNQQTSFEESKIQNNMGQNPQQNPSINHSTNEDIQI